MKRDWIPENRRDRVAAGALMLGAIAMLAASEPIPLVDPAAVARGLGFDPKDAARVLAGELLGWTPNYTDVKSIVETAWRWHRSHPNGYAS